MNIQQLEYLVALDKHRHFVAASEACGVTQPTLSMMVQKLENELGVPLFNRKKYPIEPTPIGKKIIEQAQSVLRETRRIGDLVLHETEALSGKLSIGIIPTLAPYILPNFIRTFKSNDYSIDLALVEMNTSGLIEALKAEKIDMFIAATPLKEDDFFEIPIFYERFVAYLHTEHPSREKNLSANTMPQDNLWVLEEGHCLRDQVFNFCSKKLAYNQIFEAGTIETLIRIIDINGGYSIIPELHVPFLTETQKNNIRAIENPPAIREISLVIKNTFVKERMINLVADTIKQIIPPEMLDERLKKFTIKLV